MTDNQILLIMTNLTPKQKSVIDKAVDKTVKEYGDTLRALGNKSGCLHVIGPMRCLVIHAGHGQCGKCIKCGEWIPAEEINNYQQSQTNYD